jgi:hypothetical protein
MLSGTPLFTHERRAALTNKNDNTALQELNTVLAVYSRH